MENLQSIGTKFMYRLTALLCVDRKGATFFKMVIQHKESGELRYHNATYARHNQRAPLNRYIQHERNLGQVIQKRLLTENYIVEKAI